jgi:hypothetical protein
VLDALRELPHCEGVLLPAAGGKRIDIDNFRSREWLPALKAARVVASAHLRHAPHVSRRGASRPG